MDQKMTSRELENLVRIGGLKNVYPSVTSLGPVPVNPHMSKQI